MTSNNHFGITSLFPFSFNAQRVGIITSAIIHAAIMLAILLTSERGWWKKGGSVDE